MPNEERSGSPVTRRHWLKVTGGGLTAAALAGCGQSSDDNTASTTAEPNDDGSVDSDSDDTESGGKPLDNVFTLPSNPDIARKDLGFNNFNSENKSIQIQSTMADGLMGIDQETGEYVPHIVDSVKIDGDVMTAKVNTDYGWSNGEPITAKDLETQFTIQIGHDYSIGDFVESVTTADEETAVFQLTGEVNPDVIKQKVFLSNLETPHQVFGDYAQRFKDASGEEEKKAVQEDIASLAITLDENTDKLITSGALKFGDVNNKRVMLVPNENHPHSEDINYDGVEFLWVKDNSAALSLLKSDRLDAMEGKLSKSFVDSLPDHHFSVDLPEFGGNAIEMYLKDELYGDVRVRQAFNYLIDQEMMAKASDFISKPVKYMAGTPDFLVEQYVPEETLEKFSTYERDPEKAGELLRDAGFTKEGGKWYQPNGDQWKPSIGIASGSTDRIKEISVAVNLLKKEGVEAQMSIQESSSYWKSIRQRDYRIATYAWGSRSELHPFLDYDYLWIGRNYNDENEAWVGLEDTVEVPGTVGDPDSEKESWNIREMVTELGKTQDADRQQELITKLAWMYNQYLIDIPVSASADNIVMTSDDWDIPSESSMENSRHTPQTLLRNGMIQAKTE